MQGEWAMASRPGRMTGGIALLLCVATLAGCVADRNWRAPAARAPQSLASQNTLAAVAVQEDAWPVDTWWKAFGDPQLDKLIDEALADAPTLTVAEARLHAAQAAVVQANGVRKPSTAINEQTTRERLSANDLYPPPYGGSYFTDSRLALDFSYDLDFWGRNRKALEAAQANAQAADADRAAARLALTVAIARAYIQLDLQYALHDVALSNLQQESTLLDLTRERATAGLETTARVGQQEAVTALTRAGVTYTQASIDLAKTGLADLVGAGPDRGIDLTRPHLRIAGELVLPSKLPADLLARRPDIAAQRWRVEAAAHGVASAEAAFYPNINLVAYAGLQALGVSNLFQGASTIVGVGPAVHLPIFNRDELRGALQTQRAQFEESVGQYDQSLIDAAQDVANVVTNWSALEQEAVEEQQAAVAAQNAYDVTVQRYRAGLDNYITVLSSQNELLLTEALGAEITARRLSLSTDLVRALGGGYVPPRT
jgi:NodT family efflux transporter outer membrane factor (OMF) lipoprotein